MSQDALRRIAENKKTKAERLCLSHSNFASGLPRELSEFTWLRKLDLAFSEVADISPLEGLDQLQSLHLDLTQVADIAALKGLTKLETLSLRSTQVTDISPLKGLTQLQSLCLDGLKVSDISLLEGLTRLQILALYDTLVADISPLKGLTQLHSLHLGGTKVADLSALQGLARLKILHINNTQVTDISPLRGLTHLHTLWLHGLQSLTDFSALKEISARAEFKVLRLYDTSFSDLTLLRPMIERGIDVKLKWGDGITVENCPLTNPPLEIVKQGNAAILQYWDDRK